MQAEVFRRFSFPDSVTTYGDLPRLWDSPWQMSVPLFGAHNSVPVGERKYCEKVRLTAGEER